MKKVIHNQNKQARNKAMLADYRSKKFSSWQLVAKYELSYARINTIIREMEALGY